MVRFGAVGWIVCCGVLSVAAHAEDAASAPAAAPVASRPVAAAASRASAIPVTRVANALRPFDEVIKGARKQEGLITIWQQDEKFWLELKPSDLGKRFLLAPKLRQGLGEGRLYGGAMLPVREVEFRRIHNLVQLLAFNPQYRNDENKSQSLALAAAYSPSLVGSGAVVSLPHPQRKSVLVDANVMFLPDLMGAGLTLNHLYRQNYVLDARNSAITKTRVNKEALDLEVQQHFYAATLLSSIPNNANNPSAPQPSLPSLQPDPRSLFLTFHYSLLAPPAVPLQPRLADQRVGHFTTRVVNLADDSQRSPVRHYVNRWRLEKKDPGAALSEPVKPIVFWLDPTIPERYRPAVTEGILEWNKAFERIGFKNAIQVKLADGKVDTLDMGHASVRWLADAAAPFGAIGPSQVDPRTGEILDADVSISGLFIRSQRYTAMDQEGSSSLESDARYEAFMEDQLDYAQDVLAVRGEMSEDDLKQYLFDALKSVTVHEIGHALGLRHNFRASRLYTAAQLADPAFTKVHGVSASVMDYVPVNLPEPGKPRPTPFQTQLGPYDYWAIEYAYKPLTPDTETAELRRIAARSTEPELGYGTDEDLLQGIDPEVLSFDLGRDPVAFARSRIAIAKDLIARQTRRVYKPGEDYSGLRHSLSLALTDIFEATNALSRQIGGVKTWRDLPGSGRDPIQVLDAASQRKALALLTKEILSADSFNLPPVLLRQSSVDYLARADIRGDKMLRPGLSLAALSLRGQKIVLDRVFNNEVITQILDSSASAPKGEALGLREMWSKVEQAVWSELKTGSEIPALRRDVQREYLNRVVALLLKPASLSRADARALLRAQARELLQNLRTAKRSGRSPEAIAHLQDCQEQLQQALSAPMARLN